LEDPAFVLWTLLAASPLFSNKTFCVKFRPNYNPVLAISVNYSPRPSETSAHKLSLTASVVLVALPFQLTMSYQSNNQAFQSNKAYQYNNQAFQSNNHNKLLTTLMLTLSNQPELRVMMM
jgi:hypothetical protein